MDTLNRSDETRYRIIKSVHIGVKLLYDHEGTTHQDLTKRLLTLTVNNSGKSGIGEVRYENVAFRMNATFGEALRKVLTGFIIMELDMEWSRVRRRCPGMKRVSGQSRFGLKCHAQTVQERGRERERERETNRKAPINSYTKKREKNGTYA